MDHPARLPSALGRYRITGSSAALVASARREERVTLDAYDPVLERAVLVHAMREQDDGAEAFGTPLYEARLLAGFRHPWIIAVLDAGNDAGYEYFVTESVASNLAQALAREPAGVPAERCVHWIIDAATTLQYVHARGLVHRDVQLATLCLGAQGSMRVAGFGLAGPAGAEVTAEEQRARVRMGPGNERNTPRHMPPEMILGIEPPAPQGDIWALGASFYELLTGTPPFTGTGVWTVAHDIVKRGPALPTALNRAVPAVIERIVMRCLAKEPQDRYASAEALAGELRDWQRVQHVVHKPQVFIRDAG